MGLSTLRTRRPRQVTGAMAAVAMLAASLFTAPLAFAQERLAPIGGASATLADGSRPVVVLTVASLNKLMRDVNYITGVAGQPQFGGMFSMMAGAFAQGMDLDQPIVVMVPMVNGTPQPIIALPTSDIATVLKRLEAQTGPVDKLDDGTLVVTVNQTTLYIKQAGERAYAAQDRDALGLAPADPSGMIKGMGNAYDLAVRLQVQQVPAEVRDILMDQLRQGFEQAMSQQKDAESTREMAEGSIEQLEQLVREADELNFGLNIDESARNIAIDGSFTALPGTQLAAIYGGQNPIPSSFASVIRDDVAAYFHSAASISPEAIDQASAGIESSMAMLKGAMANEGNLPPEAQQKIESYVGRLTEIVSASLSEGKSDFGGMLVANSEKLQFVMGAFVADGNEVAKLAKDLATEIPDDPRAPRFMFDIGKSGNVTMHMIEADVPPQADEARTVFGDKLQIHIGTGPQSLYLAVGKGSESVLKQFIASGATNDDGRRPLGQFKLSLLPILEFARSVESNAGIDAVINAVSGSPGGGQVDIVSNTIDNGASSNIKIGEGLIKAIGAAVAAGQQRQQGGQPF